jgi:Carboxypeptidase regulatory-like domain
LTGPATRTIGCQILLMVGLLPSLFGQSASLRGQVMDESGAVVPGARVVLTGPNSQARTATADEKGSYSFASVAPGSYTVQASAPQLMQPQGVAIALQAGPQTLNLTLQVASMAQKVTVQENSTNALSTQSANNASALVLRGADLDALSDDPDDLAADLQALAGPSAGPNGGSIFVDGFSGGQLPPKESIREIRINQNPFSPEYDKLGYGKIEIFTKPGFDKYRGSAQWNFANDFWNTRNPYAPAKAYFLLNEFEGNAGGPLTKKASFTLDAQRNMVDNGSITDAVTLNPQTLAAQPFSGALVTPGRYTNVSPRIDYQISANNTLMFRYGVTHSDVQDNGIGAFDLTSRGYHTQFTNQTVQAADTAVIGQAVNETRFQFFRSASQAIANGSAAAVMVLQSFNSGGASVGRTFDTLNNYELQNYTSIVKGSHSWRFGVRLRGQTDDNVAPQNFNGTFTFAGGVVAPVLDAQNQPVVNSQGQPETAPITSIESYRRTLLFGQLGYSAAQIRALGGGASQFSITTGTAGLDVHQFDAGFFAGDEWRLRPNFTLDLGMRYETQTNIHDYRDIAPRAAFAWAPGGAGKRSATVIRGGFGIFYDRFPLSDTLAAERYNGIVQQQYVVTDPNFYPNLPPLSALAGFQSTQVTQEISSHLRAPYILQSAVTVERQLPRNTTLAVTYTNSHGLHELRSADINAPLPGTYDGAVPNSGVYPLGHPGAVELMESSGLYNQNQLISNVNAKLNSGFSLFGFYVYNRAYSNTDGLGTFPANPYNFSGEYGPAATDIHHRVTVGGSINLKWAVRISPFVVLQSGAPFDITTGNDPYGTTLFNARPGFATGLNKPGLIQTSYGLLDPNPTPGEPLVPRNFGRGPGQYNVNLRIAKVIGFGRDRAASGDPRPSSAAGSPLQAATGRGLGGLIGTPSTSHRFNLSIGLSIRNLLNHTNPGPIIGNITSPYFGSANQIAGGQNGEGFYETANNRRLESQIKFTF